MVQIFYRPRHMPSLLGVSRSTYYEIVRLGLLKYSRLWDGGPRVHLPEHVREFQDYLRQREVRRTPADS